MRVTLSRRVPSSFRITGKLTIRVSECPDTENIPSPNRVILHDPEVFENPFEFIPERYFGKDGKIDSSVLDAEIAAFGHGRRSVNIQALLLGGLEANSKLGPTLEFALDAILVTMHCSCWERRFLRLIPLLQ
jgi:hypothetical protein